MSSVLEQNSKSILRLLCRIQALLQALLGTRIHRVCQGIAALLLQIGRIERVLVRALRLMDSLV